MDVLVAPVLHNRGKVKLLAVNTLLPQLFTGVTTGVAGKSVGDAVELAEALVQPLSVCVTV